MAAPKLSLADLEDAVSKGTAEGCLRALWHATDILVSGTYSEEQIWTFGEIMARLAEEIELGARISSPKNWRPAKTRHSKSSSDWPLTIGSKWRGLCSDNPNGWT